MPQIVFSSAEASCSWVGSVFSDDDVLSMVETIAERALDLAYEAQVRERLESLSDTGASSEWLQDFMQKATDHSVLPWQFGEALAEAVLELDGEVIFPWNNRRDERNQRASLPGADLVGISEQATGCRLAFGEVKSSSDRTSPPGVLHGKSGMTSQLERLMSDQEIQFTLLRWLTTRVEVGSTTASKFDEAVASFISSQGRCLRIIGVLVRDTEPNENDLSSRGQKLAAEAVDPCAVELHALYLPRPMSEWPTWVET